MCTMSWLAETGRFQIFFNRDERRTRSPAAPPQIRENGGVRFIAPLDVEGGGTWIAVTERGLSLAVLNGYAPSDLSRAEPAGGWRSRGLLVTSLTDAATPAEVFERLDGTDLSPYRSFWLAALDDRGRGSLAIWQDEAYTFHADIGPLAPLISSSYRTEAVRANRRERFERSVTTPDAPRATERHLRYHESHEPERGPFSTCMHRDDAKTVSFSRIEVTDGAVAFHYAPHSPCRGRPDDEPVRLERTDRVPQ